MNIDNLPYARDPKFVWLIFLILASFILSIIWIMKRKKWF